LVQPFGRVRHVVRQGHSQRGATEALKRASHKQAGHVTRERRHDGSGASGRAHAEYYHTVRAGEVHDGAGQLSPVDGRRVQADYFGVQLPRLFFGRRPTKVQTDCHGARTDYTQNTVHTENVWTFRLITYFDLTVLH